MPLNFSTPVSSLHVFTQLEILNPTPDESAGVNPTSPLLMSDGYQTSLVTQLKTTSKLHLIEKC